MFRLIDTLVYFFASLTPAKINPWSVYYICLFCCKSGFGCLCAYNSLVVDYITVSSICGLPWNSAHVSTSGKLGR